MPFLTRAQAAAMSEADRLDYLTKTILGEAVGEGFVGMTVVAQVIANRAKDGRWPSDPVAVAGQSHQFTTNSDGEGGNQAMISRYYGPKTREYQMAQQAAQIAIIDQTAPDITGGGLYYHTTAMGFPASWPSSIASNGFLDIGRHRVYPSHPVPPGLIPDAISTLVYTPVGYSPTKTAPAPAIASPFMTMRRGGDTTAIRSARGFQLSADSMVERGDARVDPARAYRATGVPGQTGPIVAPATTPVKPQAKPPAVAAAPWGVREAVAAATAAAAVQSGRGQMVVDGDPNISGSVVDWLYGQDQQPVPEANQNGKGDRLRRTGQSQIERGDARPSPAPGQSNIERGDARIIPPSGPNEAQKSNRGRPDTPAAAVAAGDVVRKSMDAVGAQNPASYNKTDRATAPLDMRTSRIKPIVRINDRGEVRLTDSNALVAGDALVKGSAAAAGAANSNQRLAYAVAAHAAQMAARQEAAAAAPVVSAQETRSEQALARIGSPRLKPQGNLAFIAPVAAPVIKPIVVRPVSVDRKIDPIGSVPNFSDLAALGGSRTRLPDLPAATIKPVDGSVTHIVQPPRAGVPKAAPAPQSRPANLGTEQVADVALPVARPERTPYRGKVAPTPRPLSERPAAAPVAIARTAPRATSRTPTITVQGGNTSGGYSGGSASRAPAQPHFVSASTGQTLTPRTINVYDADTNTFGKRTVYRP